MGNEFVFYTLDTLDTISVQAASLYRRLCRGTGVTRNETLLEHIKSNTANAHVEYPRDVYTPRLKDSVIEVLLRDETTEKGTNYIAVNDSMIDIVADLLRHLKEAIKDATELFRQINQNNPQLPEEGVNVVDGISLSEMLSIRTEQVAELKVVLNAYKEENEQKIENLKSKYETEKAIVSETMLNLREELNALKKRDESFNLLRSMFVTKYEKFLCRQNELQLQLIASNEEINDINSLMSEMCTVVAENKATCEDNSEDIRELNSALNEMCSIPPKMSSKHEDM